LCTPITVNAPSRVLGLDVGKGEHHATAVTLAGKNTFDKRLRNSEPALIAALPLTVPAIRDVRPPSALTGNVHRLGEWVLVTVWTHPGENVVCSSRCCATRR
jgi:hypothetical protein